MSWDLVLMRLPAGIETLDGLPDDYCPEPLGSARDVRAALAQIPGIRLPHRSGGSLESPNWVIEIDIHRGDPVEAVFLDVHGTGDDVLPAVFRIAAAVGCRVMQCDGCELLVEGDTSGWHAFQAYRDRVLHRSPAPPVAGDIDR